MVLESCRQQLVTINEVLLKLYHSSKGTRDTPLMNQFLTCQHVVPSCRASWHAAVCQLRAAKMLRALSEADLLQCREGRDGVVIMHPMTSYLTIVPVGLLMLNGFWGNFLVDALVANMWTWFVVASVALFGSSMWAGIAFFSFLALVLVALVVVATATNSTSYSSSTASGINDQKEDESNTMSPPAPLVSVSSTSAVAVTGTMESPSNVVIGVEFTDIEQSSRVPVADR
jgi:hypothetical protein